MRSRILEERWGRGALVERRPGGRRPRCLENRTGCIVPVLPMMAMATPAPLLQREDRTAQVFVCARRLSQQLGARPHLAGTAHRRADLRMGRAGVVLDGRSCRRLRAHPPPRYLGDLEAEVGHCHGIGHMKLIVGHSLESHWEDVPIWKAPGRAHRRARCCGILFFGEVMCHLIRAWQQTEHVVYVQTIAMDNHGQPRNWGDGARWINHLAYADALVLITKSESDAREIYNAMQGAAHGES